eukprot:835315-Prorocentrum_minimum.AAC.5
MYRRSDRPPRRASFLSCRLTLGGSRASPRGGLLGRSSSRRGGLGGRRSRVEELPLEGGGRLGIIKKRVSPDTSKAAITVN